MVNNNASIRVGYMQGIEAVFVNSILKYHMQKIIEISTFRSLLKTYNIPYSYDKILDVGCGAGYGLKLLEKYYSPRFLAGCDIDPKEVAIAKQNAPATEVIIADICDLPYTTGMFDMVFAFTVLHHVQRWKRSFSELHRILNERGILLFDELNKNFLDLIDTIIGPAHPKESRFTWDEIETIVNESGFSIICNRKIANIMNFYVCRKSI